MRKGGLFCSPEVAERAAECPVKKRQLSPGELVHVHRGLQSRYLQSVRHYRGLLETLSPQVFAEPFPEWLDCQKLRALPDSDAFFKRLRFHLAYARYIAMDLLSVIHPGLPPIHELLSAARRVREVPVTLTSDHQSSWARCQFDTMMQHAESKISRECVTYLGYCPDASDISVSEIRMALEALNVKQLNYPLSQIGYQVNPEQRERATRRKAPNDDEGGMALLARLRECASAGSEQATVFLERLVSGFSRDDLHASKLERQRESSQANSPGNITCT